MTHYLSGEGWFKDGSLVGVTVHNTASPEAPDWHLHEPFEVDLSGLLSMLKNGDSVEARFDTDLGEIRLPVVVRQHQGGQEVAEVSAPEGSALTLANLRPGRS